MIKITDYIYKRNLEALKGYVDTWYDFLTDEKYELNPNIKIVVDYDRYGHKIFRVCNEQKCGYISGKYEPIQAVKDWMTEQKCSSYRSLIILLGLGDGLALKTMLTELGPEARIIVYEPSIEIFIKCIQEIDLSWIIDSKRVAFVVDKINEDEFERILASNVTIENMTQTYVYISGNYEYLFHDDIVKKVSKIDFIISGMRVNLNTKTFFANTLNINVVHNLKFLYHGYTMNQLFQILKPEFPCIIVAAGPSLDKNIKELKKIQHRACVIACDTALKPLLKNGVKPDLFLVVDPRKPIELFEDERISEIPMVMPADIPFGIMEKHKGRKYFYISDNELVNEAMRAGLSDKVKTMSYKESFTSLGTGGSVATSAFCLAKYMGSRNIILVGQDLAMTGNKKHAEGTFLDEKEVLESELQGKEYIKVDGIDGKPVYTISNLQQYLKWYENIIENDPDTKVIDATEGGALIHGTQVETLRESIYQNCKETIDFEDLTKEIPEAFSVEGKQALVKYFESIPERIKKTKSKICYGEKLYQELLNFDLSVGDAKQLNRLNQRIKKNQEFLETDSIAMVLMECLHGVQATMRISMYQFEDDEQAEIETIAKQGLLLLKQMEKVLRKLGPIMIEELSKN